MFKTTLLTTIAASAAIFGSASAGEGPFYVALHYGFDSPADEEIRGSNVAGADRNIDIDFESGSYFGASLGVVAKEGEFGRLRFEVEAAHREAEVDALALNDVDRRFRDDSQLTTTTVMINGLYDTPLLADRFRLFAGGGFGIANQDHDVRYLVERSEEAGGNLAIAIPSSETTWSAQGILGGEWVISPKLSAVADVRFVQYGDTQVERYVLTTGAIDSVLDAENSTITSTIGLRLSF